MKIIRKPNVDINIVKLLTSYRKKNVSYTEALLEIQSLLHMDIDDIVELLPNDIFEEIKIDMVSRRLTKDEKISKIIESRNNDDITEWL